jgi:hypothetical protein
MRLRRRSAFTLFQLLTLLALLALMLALFLPAVQKVRTAAARIQSTNNLKQITLGFHAYYDANQVFPAGCDANHFSAYAQLLPYIEQDNLYKTIDFKKDVGDKANATARGALIKVFFSPLDPVIRGNPDFGPTSYLLNAGSQYALKDNDGVFFLDSKVRLPDITDGTSNTLMEVETLKGNGGDKADSVQRQHVALAADDLMGLTDDSGVKYWKDGAKIAGDRGASWMDGRFLQATCNFRLAYNDPRPDVTCGGAGGVFGVRGPANGTNVGIADGSVRFINPKLKVETWRQLATRAGGEVINDPNY